MNKHDANLGRIYRKYWKHSTSNNQRWKSSCPLQAAWDASSQAIHGEAGSLSHPIRHARDAVVGAR